MKVRDILRKGLHAEGDTNREISGVAYDSRKVRGGEVFVAIKGEKFDGRDFIEDAIGRGAVAVVYEKEARVNGGEANFLSFESEPAFCLRMGRMPLASKHPGIVWICVDDARDAIASISSDFYGKPSEDIAVIGITGTNGKTTTSYLIKSILERSGGDAGLIGTINYLIKDAVYEALHTTPESPDFQFLLRKMADSGCSYVVAEVSSHSLSQKRVDYTRFRGGIFTNLTRDHLDFHGTMENYYSAKERLFTELLAEGAFAVINIDDPYGERLLGALKERRQDIRTITYAVENRTADVTVFDISVSFKGTSFKVKGGGADAHEFFSPLVGNTNVFNMLSAICAAMALDIPLNIIKEGIAMTGLVKGRFEKVDLGQDFLAVVDYAHTEDALERLLKTAHQLLEAYRFAEKTEKIMKEKRSQFTVPEKTERGKIITVIGCGGNRDRGKRSRMGEVASKLSDFVIVTSDNPRYEDPKAIIRDIERGIKSDNYIVIPDRKVAIGMAVELASSGDIVLVAGKGHEDYQEVQGVRHGFSDRTALETAIKRTTSRPAFGGGSTLAGLYSSGAVKN